MAYMSIEAPDDFALRLERVKDRLINIAVAEKLSVLRTESYFRERVARANRENFLEILNKAGTQAPREGDELP